MEQTQQNQERRILLLALRAGKILLENGAEISRVEDTVYRICRYYGMRSVNAFVLSNGIFLTAGDQVETEFSKVMQIPVNNTNLGRVAEVNQLSRLIEEHRYTPEKALAELERIEQMPGFPRKVQIGAAGVASLCFCFMFGGVLQDLACACFIGILTQTFLLLIGQPHLSKIVCNIIGGGLVTVLTLFCYKLGLGLHLTAMLMGGVILMVPGMAFTNGIRDLADGDYISGSVRMLDAVLVFFCIAMGVGSVIALYNSLIGGILL